MVALLVVVAVAVDCTCRSVASGARCVRRHLDRTEAGEGCADAEVGVDCGSAGHVRLGWPTVRDAPADSTGMKRIVRDDLRRVRDTTPQWSHDLISRPDFRRTVVSAVGAVTAASLGSALGNPYGRSVHVKVTALVCASAFVILAVLAVRSAAGELSRVITGRAGAAAGAAVRLTILLSGYLLTLLIGLALLAVPVQHLLVGGALTGVLIGIAAQQALGNVFAGLVLLLNRPFTIGDHIRIRSGALGGEFDGTVTGMGLTYVALDTTSGPLQVPNSSILAAAVGPWTEAAADDADAELATTVTSTDPGQGLGLGPGRT